MKPVHHSIRLPISHDKALRALAEWHGVSTYAMLQRSVKPGIATLANPPAPDTSNRELVTELTSVRTRIVDVERMLARSLFTACAASCYARNASLRAPPTHEPITADVTAATARPPRPSPDQPP